MIYKVAGTVAVVASAYLTARAYSRTMAEYAALLADTAAALAYMKREAVARSIPLDKLAVKICTRFQRENVALFDDACRYMEKGELFSHAFSKAVQGNKLLKGEDKAVLCEFAHGASMCPMAQVEEYSDSYIKILEEKVQNAESEAAKKGKLMQSVSVLAGAFAAVLLM